MRSVLVPELAVYSFTITSASDLLPLKINICAPYPAARTILPVILLECRLSFPRTDIVRTLPPPTTLSRRAVRWRMVFLRFLFLEESGSPAQESPRVSGDCHIRQLLPNQFHQPANSSLSFPRVGMRRFFSFFLLLSPVPFLILQRMATPEALLSSLPWDGLTSVALKHHLV